jgi:hypothetical protein
MKIRAAVLAVLAACAASAHASVINFDDLSNPGCCTFPSAGYGGFDWSGGSGANSWVVAEVDTHVFSGTNAHSGSNFAWSNGGTSLDLTRDGGGTFDFTSMWARTGWLSSGYTVTGYLDGAVVGSQHVAVTQDYAFASFDLVGVDDVTIVGDGGNLLIDDINVGTTAAVPEPSEIALMLAGLGGLAAQARRRASRGR